MSAYVRAKERKWLIRMKQLEEFRKGAGEGDKKRDEGLLVPKEIERYVDIAYDNKDSKWNLLDVYCPKERNGLLPVIVSVHGGGWVYGDKEVYQFYCMELAKEGFAVVNFSYRLAPEYKFPAALEDTNAVMEWVFEHGAEYGMDLENIFFVGDSAGAHLASLYIGICTKPEYAKKYDFKIPEGLKPKAAALNCGVYDFYEELRNEESNVRGLAEAIFEEKKRKEQLELFQPVNVVTKEFPPVFLMTCENDFLAGQAPFMKRALEKAGVFHEYHLYGEGQKEIGHVFHCNIRLEEAKKCNKAECDFFKRFI